jgi:signal transduction histidine kinase
MRILAVLTVLFWFVAPAYSQKQGQAMIDSLLLEVNKAPNDSLKVRIYKQIADGYFFIDTEKALHYSRIGLAHAHRVPWQRAISAFTMSIGRAFSDKGMIDSCLYYYNRALIMQKAAGDNRNIATTLTNMGTAEQNIRSDYPKATQYYFEALGYAEKDKSPYMIAAVYDNLSVIYISQNDNAKALSYALKSLNICEKQDGSDPNFMNEWAIALSNTANAYSAMQDSANAKRYFERALAMYRKAGSIEGLASTFFGLSSLPNLNLAERIALGLKAKSLWDQINPVNPSAIDNVGNLGIAYFDLVRNGTPEQYTKFGSRKSLLVQAEEFLNTAIRLSEQKGAIRGVSYYTGALSELQAMKGDYAHAYKNLLMHQHVEDSLFSQENKNKIARLEGKREIELRDKQIELNNLALESQQKQRIAFLLGLGLLSVIGGLLFWQNQARKRANATLVRFNAELDEANKIKARLFAILSHDLRSPVANLIHFLHLQKEGPELLTPEMTEIHQKRITEAAEGLLENMESMLLWSKGQMEHFNPQKKVVPVSELFLYIQKFFQATPNVQFVFDNPENLDVVTDEDYLKTIMQNLTSNAVKALKNKPDPEIKWTASQDGPQIILTISDNGQGTSDAQLRALFSDEVSIGIRSGLGLHLIRDLAKAITCTISAKPAPGGGMEFKLAIPV